MLYTQILVSFLPIIASATSVIIRLDEERTTKPLESSKTSPSDENKPADTKIYAVVTGINENVDSVGSYFEIPINAVRNGVKKIYRGIGIPILKNGEVEQFGKDDVSNKVSDRVDNIENKVETLSEQLSNLKALAGVYFISRLLSGFLFSWMY